MKLEAESRMKESKRLLTSKKEEKNVSSIKKIEVRSSSSSLSEDDPVTIIPSLPPQPFPISFNNNMRGGQSRNGFDLSSTMTKTDQMPDSSEVSFQGRESVGLQSDSAATSDYSESDSGTPVRGCSQMTSSFLGGTLPPPPLPLVIIRHFWSTPPSPFVR